MQAGRRLRDEHGQSTTEYVGVLVVVAAIAAALLLTNSDSTLSLSLREAVCNAFNNGDCGGSAVAGAPGGGPADGDGAPAAGGANAPAAGGPAPGGNGSGGAAGSGTANAQEFGPNDPTADPRDTNGDGTVDADETRAAQGRRPTSEILDDYQVSVDPDGTTMYPGWPGSMFIEPREITKGEAALLDDIGWLAQKDFADIRDDAYSTARERFPTGAEDGHQDAFRHAYWNALMVQRFGSDWATKFGTAHERLAGNPADREAMDLYNNEIGRRIAEQNSDASPSELADLVEQAIRDGEMVVIGADGELYYSDEVPEGETGQADDAPRDDAGGDPPPDDESETGGGYDPGDPDGGGPRSDP